MVHRLPALAAEEVASCRRCRSVIHAPGRGRVGNERARALALAALVLFPAAVTLPIMKIERFGHMNEASIWSGSLSLLQDGELLVGAVVFLCSMVIPLSKLFGILFLTGGGRFLSRAKRATTYHWIELAGRWGMLDVLLVAVVVAWLKVGDLVEVRPGPAAISFTACVVLSLLASACFDPHALWLRASPDGAVPVPSST